MTTPIERVLDHLENVRAAGAGKWMARCPVHDDRQNSLSIATGDDGRALVRCFAACDTGQIVAALGLTLADLFPEGGGGRGARRIVAETDYRILDEHGACHGIHRRRDYNDGKKDVFWLAPDGRGKGLNGRSLDTMPLYGSEHLAARSDEPVIICEGEKAAQALLDAGYLAVGTVTGASSAPRAEVLALLAGREVLLWPDHDVPGASHMMRIMRTLDELQISHRLITWPGAPDKGDAYDCLAMRGDVDALIAAAVAPRSANATPPLVEQVRRIIRAGDSPLTPPEYLIDGVLPKSGLVSLVAKESAYKTFAAIGMAAAVHTGTAWAGNPAERAPVLYLAAEGAGGMRRRLRAWEIANEADLADLWILPASVNFLDSDDLERLAAEIDTLGELPRLIVVDTLARNMSGNENAAEDMGRFIAACDRLRTLTGGTVLVVHHENKLGGYRGSTAFAGAMDTMIEAKRDGMAVTLTCTKQKDGNEFDPIHLAARVVELGFTDRYDRPVSSIVLKPTDATFVQRQRDQAEGERALTPSERAALEALQGAPDRRMTYSEWQKASGLTANTFDRTRSRLIERGLVRNLSAGAYTPTPIPPPNDPQITSPHPHAPIPMGVGVKVGVAGESEEYADA